MKLPSPADGEDDMGMGTRRLCPACEIHPAAHPEVDDEKGLLSAPLSLEQDQQVLVLVVDVVEQVQ